VPARPRHAPLARQECQLQEYRVQELQEACCWWLYISCRLSTVYILYTSISVSLYMIYIPRRCFFVTLPRFSVCIRSFLLRPVFVFCVFAHLELRWWQRV
jgi:hypothetical protein